MPRALLSEKLQTTPAMTTRCVQRMQTEGLVHEKGKSKGRGGRMCTNVEPNPDAGILIGIEYNPQNIVTVAINFACRIEKQLSFPLPQKAREGSPKELIAALVEAIQKTIHAVPRSRPLLGIAAVDPGVIDRSAGTTVSSNALPKWKQVPLRQILTDQFNVPVHLSNTTNAILAAVDRCELERRYANVLYLEYRDGVSCGIKSNGRQVLGTRGMAGEMTRFTANPTEENHHPTYTEQSLGFSAIRQCLHDQGHPAFQDAVPRADMIQTLLALAARGDSQVTQVLKEIWHCLGHLCGTLANLLDPEVIVLDPRFGQADSESLEALKRGLKEQMVAPHTDQIEIRVSELKEPAAPLGAALTLLDDLTFNYEFS